MVYTSQDAESGRTRRQMHTRFRSHFFPCEHQQSTLDHCLTVHQAAPGSCSGLYDWKECSAEDKASFKEQSQVCFSCMPQLLPQLHRAPSCIDREMMQCCIVRIVLLAVFAAWHNSFCISRFSNHQLLPCSVLRGTWRRLLHLIH